MTEQLSSPPKNPKVKRLLALQKDSSLRRETGLFVVEGRRELQHCIDAGFHIDSFFVCPELCPAPELPSGAKVFEISRAVYERIAYREGTEGVIAEVRAKYLRLDDLSLPAEPLIVVLESVEKPGNLGAVLRSADAAGADAVLICDPLTDLYNPNLVRASIGAVFTVPCVACSSADAIKWLKDKGISILTAQLQDSSLYYETDMVRGSAIVMGTESTGLSQIWRDAESSHIRIPMLGRLDSLNVSVSAAILLFEAVRQRRRQQRRRQQWRRQQWWR